MIYTASTFFEGAEARFVRAGLAEVLARILLNTLAPSAVRALALEGGNSGSGTS